MATKRKVTGTASSLPFGVGLGLLLSIVTTLMGAAILGYLIVGERIGEDAIGVGSMIVLILASLVGSITAINLVKRLRIQVCSLVALGYYLSLLACTALFFGGQYTGMLTTGIVILVSCGGVALLYTFLNNGGKVKRRKKAYR